MSFRFSTLITWALILRLSLKGSLSAHAGPTKPTAILMVSAHWEASPAVRVTSSPSPPMLFDYYGFPPEAYEFSYLPPGDPTLAKRVQSLIHGAGSGEDSRA